MTKEKYISLKEAAEIAGYSPDYVGQLIRAGKLPGKQVFSNIAWMTTEEAVRDYVEKGKRGVSLKVRHEKDATLLYKSVLWGTIVLLSAFVLFLIYVFSVSIDHRINQQYQEKIQRL